MRVVSLRARLRPLISPSLAAFRDGPAWRAILLPLLFAIAWQSVVIQTHRHLDLATGIQAVAQASMAEADSSDRSSPVELPSACPICREVAHAGHAVLAVTFILVAPVQHAVRAILPTLAPALAGQRTHAWRSRAPPAVSSTQR